MIETIKDYLVSLGFEVDKGSFDDATKRIGNFEQGVKELASGFVLNMGKAALAITGIAASAAAGTAKFLDGLGNQEIQMEMLARQLWTTQQQAQAFSLTLKAMRASLGQLYLSPTLMNQYRQLNALAQQMQTPSDYNNQMQLVQSVSLQFKQMKLEAYYSLQWIGYYFIKYMAGPITTVRNALASINSAIVKNMPSWTKRVAEVMASFVQAGIYIVHALSDVFNWMKRMQSYIPGWAKGIALALGAIDVVLMLNPFGAFVAVLGAAILLLDDFETYIHGGKSALGPFWQMVMQVVDGFKQWSAASGFVTSLPSALENISQALQDLGHWFGSLMQQLTNDGALTSFENSTKDLGSAMSSLVQSIGDLFGQLTSSKNQTAMQNFGQLMKDMVEGIVRMVAAAVEDTASLIKMVADITSGNSKGALKDMKDYVTGQNLVNAGIVPQSWLPWTSAPPTSSNSYAYHVPPAAPQYSQPAGPPYITINQTNNISGTDPQETANVLQNNVNPMLMRNLRSVMH